MMDLFWLQQFRRLTMEEYSREEQRNAYLHLEVERGFEWRVVREREKPGGLCDALLQSFRGNRQFLLKSNHPNPIPPA